MSKVWIIFRKDFRGFLTSPSYWFVLGLAAVVMSFIYPLALQELVAISQNRMFQMQAPPQAMNIHFAVFARHLQMLNLVCIFLVPALTMRLLSEEKKLRTMDLLLTSPIESWHIVVGKFAAGFLAIAVLVGLAFLYPLATVPFAKIEWVPLVVAFAGFFLVCAVYLAVDLFCSSLSESALIAYVLAVILNISLWIVGAGASAVDGAVGRQIFEHISLGTHLEGFMTGLVRTSSLIFFASLIALFVFLAERVVESSRWR